jgi:hypothetical protein
MRREATANTREIDVERDGRPPPRRGAGFYPLDALTQWRMRGEIAKDSRRLPALFALEIRKSPAHRLRRNACAHERGERGIVSALLIPAQEVERRQIAGQAAEHADVAHGESKSRLEAEGAQNAFDGMPLNDMLHLVGDDGGELFTVLHAFDQAAKDKDVAARALTSGRRTTRTRNE